MDATTVKQSRLGQKVPVDTKGGPIDGIILMVNYWDRKKNFGFAVDDAGTKHFVSGNAHRKMRDGRDNPAFGDKTPQHFERGTDIVGTVHEGDKGLYVGAFCTLRAYEAKVAEIGELTLYQVCKSISFGKGTQPSIQVFVETRDRAELERRYRQILQDAKGHQGVTAIYRERNENGTWVRCKNPFAAETEQAKRPSGTIKAGPKKGQPLQARAPKQAKASKAEPRKGGKKDRKKQAAKGGGTALAA